MTSSTLDTSSSQPHFSRKTIFVTVGTTRFDKLISTVTTPMALQWMESNGYTHLIIQYGKGDAPTIPNERKESAATSSLVSSSLPSRISLQIESYSFKPSLDDDMRQADLIISHAGAGTVMEALRLKKQLVVVINTLLMDNHQTELARAMADQEHLFVVHSPEELQAITTWNDFGKFVPIPHAGGDPWDFPRLLDAHMGFTTSSSSSKLD